MPCLFQGKRRGSHRPGLSGTGHPCLGAEQRRSDSSRIAAMLIQSACPVPPRNVSSIVRHLWSEFTEQFWALRLWAVWTAKEHACPHCPQLYDDCGLLIHTSIGRDGGLGMPRLNRSGCAAYAA